MNEITTRSPYWLSPGIDVPDHAEVLPGLRPMRGLYADFNHGEAAFVPTDEFMRMNPLWRLDVLGDIADSIERTRRHALVDYFRHFDSRVPGVSMERRLEVFRGACKLAGIDLPENIEAILVLDDHFKGHKSRQ